MCNIAQTKTPIIMYKIIEENGKLKFKGKYGNECIHVIHCVENLKELKEDVATPYIVAEEFSNYPRIHLITSWSEDEALQSIDEYIREKEWTIEDHEEAQKNDDYNTHLIGAFECELN